MDIATFISVPLVIHYHLCCLVAATSTVSVSKFKCPDDIQVLATVKNSFDKEQGSPENS